MHRAIVGFLLTATLAFAQSGLGTPRAGVLRDPSGHLHALWGIRGSFFLGPQWLEGALSMSSSGAYTVVKNEEGVLVFDNGMELVASQTASGSEALFAFSPGGAPFVAYVPDTSDIYRWLGNSFERVTWPDGRIRGTPLAIAAADTGAVAVVVKRGDSLWMAKHALNNGRVLHESMLPGVTDPVYLHHDGTLVYKRPETDELAVLWKGRIEQRLPFAGAVLGFERIGREWVRLIDNEGSSGLALRLECGQVALYRLPGGVE